MLKCTSLDLFGSKKHHRVLESFTIEIRSIAPPDNTETWSAAILSSNPKTRQNVVSQRLVTEVLGQPFHTLDKEGETNYEQDGIGYVDLVWCRGNGRNINTTRFFVSSIYDPPYDLVLGKSDAQNYARH
ncbi:hypothetical protein P280DRAFT_431405 [Massarina eburnea CBS 473.64]|uniref:Uncharacterized protein n=1 Tax=Massarina eburnea CBS 473.64 TaxID=1395130 RepID=A0A6A6RU51_9PLEO|nr:hypothetical protein P280DRAFT_431405 [Massarina eburnea CBS 473.64]